MPRYVWRFAAVWGCCQFWVTCYVPYVHPLRGTILTYFERIAISIYLLKYISSHSWHQIEAGAIRYCILRICWKALDRSAIPRTFLNPVLDIDSFFSASLRELIYVGCRLAVIETICRRGSQSTTIYRNRLYVQLAIYNIHKSYARRSFRSRVARPARLHLGEGSNGSLLDKVDDDCMDTCPYRCHTMY